MYTVVCTVGTSFSSDPDKKGVCQNYSDLLTSKIELTSVSISQPLLTHSGLSMIRICTQFLIDLQLFQHGFFFVSETFCL